MPIMFFKLKEPPIIISVGGSLIVPNGGVDTEFLSNLNKLVRREVTKGKRFFLVAGGGNIARHYQEAGRQVIGDINNEDLDWLGIHATRFNAHLLRTIFQDIANPRIITNYEKKLFNWQEPVAIGAGWKPGWSTDYDAVILARDYGAQLIVNLSNVDGVYDKDPKKFADAKFIKKITWGEMLKITGSKWSPGFNSPFDPVATPLAQKLGLTVIVANGHDFKNLEKIIDGEPFKGTVIMPFNIESYFFDRDYYLGKKGGHRVKHAESTLGAFFHDIKDFLRAFYIKIQLNPKTCLDVGCGLGRLVGWLRFFGIEAYGLDFSEYARSMSNSMVRKYIKLGDATNIPYPDNHFDLVVTFDLLQHLDRGEIRKSIREMIRVSKKYIFHKIYTRENLWLKFTHQPDFSNVSLFSKKYWDRLFSSFSEIGEVRNVFRLPSFFETKYLFKKK
ncbi:MAG: Aspartate/glutamate/uridylate kinase [Candidatus Roizmanbacteria bacterium GW2011_GWC2_37_13]|uniref:UMP kinase n=1 Tax=Candidatus Roizmanbacteria bacterium GW2011_GWC2_37_13 TaxID=1618486 RepID=A0A0G0J8T6_9BACT|nr:MAG: Aspartate/glutamate/uridylate kinase [Candidatus Roizmanbacteria bacterium GW2011_GWC1_37_12]KKQ24456.1 MAG: Aspartate/glutamate/uridylate kinase [Candidatus Roizmanbacteria bacterium GW2011_GWC2_37_13]